MIQTLALIGSITLPLFNIPLILKIVNRKSSRDVSLIWAWGVWGCLALMLPQGLTTTDIVWKGFCLSNFFLFSGVVAVIYYYRRG